MTNRLLVTIPCAAHQILIDLNHILLFLAIVSPLVLLVRIARLRNSRNHGWRVAAGLVLVVCAVAWFFLPDYAGYLGAIFWALLLVLPALAESKIEEQLLARRFSRARFYARIRQMLHPWNDTPYRPTLLGCVELAARGQLDRALDRLATERDAPTPAGRFATALTFSLTQNWPGLVQWARRDRSQMMNPPVYSLYLRALGEIGALDDLVFELASRPQALGLPLELAPPQALNLAFALAFCGRTRDLARLLEGRLAGMSQEGREFLLGTAELAGGQIEAGRNRLENLRAATPDAILQRAIERRLDPLQRRAQLSDRREMLLVRLVSDQVAARDEGRRRRSRGAPAVWALILLNVAMFGVELMLGGATNARTLELLGALEMGAVFERHEYWRMLTALFLHFGLLHLVVNLYALYLLGPELERIIGSLRFTLSYLLAGLGSSAGVLLLSALGLTEADLLVGASGCVMGVIGVSAGLLLRHRQSPLAGRRLRHLLVIVVLQTAFDLSTPQVSLAAHLSGFVSGFAIGLLLAARRRRPWPGR